MQYSDVIEFERAAANVSEVTRAIMLWRVDAEGELKATILGEPDELIKLYKSIFIGVLPLAREKGWLKD